MQNKLAQQPWILNYNRIKRAYKGGMVLDQWQGIEPAVDGNYPEEFLVSTVEVTNLNRYPGEGLSKVTMDDGSILSLKEMIATDPAAFLGEDLSVICKQDLGVLVRIGDPAIRLVIQAHPDAECARNYLNSPTGKTESWYIVSCRDMKDEKAHVYAGFKPGITRKKWEDLFLTQDIPGMLDAMHKIYVSAGDTVLIEAGMPHAIGPGPLFLEVHEPCDYTLRMERNYLPDRTFTDDEIHYGIGFEKLFDCFHYEPYTYDELIAKIIMRPTLIRQTDCAKEIALITYKENDRFAVNKVETTGVYVPEPYQGHRIAVLVKGSGAFLYDGGRKAVKQGQGIFLPAGIEGLKFESGADGMEIIIGYPPQSNSAK
jgi:mannose-6-phosphate isomerase